MHRKWLTCVTMVTVCVTLGAVLVQSAPATFANPAFKTQWDAGEAITVNFWGPSLDSLPNGRQEPFGGSTRLVQYFDKGRMELTNSAVTNGLLATEITQGQIQTGDATFMPQAPPAIPIAGDPDNPGPTYAGLAPKAKTLFAMTPMKSNAAVTALVAADGTVSDGSATAGANPLTTAGYDAVTQHNVLGVFGQYRDRTGLSTIGLAISEPFRASVKVGGVQKDVFVQVFERRVLTYTASNPDPFKVEMGNIGQHYYQWRTSAATTAAPASTAVSSTSIVPSFSPTLNTPIAPISTSAIPLATPHGGATVSTTGRKPGAICKAGVGATVVVCT